MLFLAIGSIELGTSARFSDTELATANTFIAGTWESLSLVGARGDGQWNSPNWVVSIYANEKKATTVTFANSSAEDISITLTASPASHDGGNLTFGFDNPILVIPGKGRASVVFWLETSQSVTPGTYLTIVTLERK